MEQLIRKFPLIEEWKSSPKTAVEGKFGWRDFWITRKSLQI